MARDKNDKHAWWKCWEDITTNRNMRRWIRIHGHWIGWAWVGCMKLANDPEKDGRLCNRKSGQAYDAFDVSDEALVSEEQAREAIALFLAAEWMHRSEDGCLVVSRFLDRNVSPDAQKKRRDRIQDKPGDMSRDMSGDTSGYSLDKCRVQRTEDRGQTEQRPETPLTPQGGQPGSLDFSDREIKSPETKAPTKKKRTKATGPDDPIALPAWVPAEPWGAFDEMRRRGKARASWTARAQQLAVNVLKRLVDDGYDPTLIIERAVASGWQSFNAHESCRPRVTHPTHRQVDRPADTGPTRAPTQKEVDALTGALGGLS